MMEEDLQKQAMGMTSTRSSMSALVATFHLPRGYVEVTEDMSLVSVLFLSFYLASAGVALPPQRRPVLTLLDAAIASVLECLYNGT